MHLGVNYIGHVHLTQLLLENMINQVLTCSRHAVPCFSEHLQLAPFMGDQDHA